MKRLKAPDEKISTRAIVYELICILLLISFAYLGIDKLWEHSKFAYQLNLSPILPGALASVLSWVLPIMFVFIAGLLIVHPTRKLGLRLYGAIMVSFILYIVALFTIAPFVPCSCIGFSELLSWKEQLCLNIVLLVLVGLGLYLASHHKKETTEQYTRLSAP